MITVQQAVISLRPGAEWTMNGDDVEGIIWHTEGVQPLTQQEVEAEMQRLQEEQENAEIERVAKKQALLDRLGITEEEAKLLLS